MTCITSRKRRKSKKHKKEKKSEERQRAALETSVVPSGNGGDSSDTKQEESRKEKSVVDMGLELGMTPAELAFERQRKKRVCSQIISYLTRTHSLLFE